MNDNITTITHLLQKEFPNRAVQHQFSDNQHTFGLHGETAAHWLYVAGELLEQSDMKSVHHLLNIYSVADTLLASPEPKCLFLDHTGWLRQYLRRGFKWRSHGEPERL